MIDKGFEPEIRRLCDDSNMRPKEERQTLMFSATFERKLQLLAGKMLDDHVVINVGEIGSANKDIKQVVELVRIDFSEFYRVMQINDVY